MGGLEGTGGTETTLGEVLAVLAEASAERCHVWVAGGWGVDALVGRQTRPHRDLDLAVDARHERDVVGLLERRGYRVETDWRPARVELVHPTRGWVDLHPVLFDETGHGQQADLDGGSFDYPPAAFATGSLDATVVRCLSAHQQRVFHTGYPPRPVDAHDLALLRALP